MHATAPRRPAGIAVLRHLHHDARRRLVQVCRVDWDHNGVVNSTDVGEFINTWFEGCEI